MKREKTRYLLSLMIIGLILTGCGKTNDLSIEASTMSIESIDRVEDKTEEILSEEQSSKIVTEEISSEEESTEMVTETTSESQITLTEEKINVLMDYIHFLADFPDVTAIDESFIRYFIYCSYSCGTRVEGIDEVQRDTEDYSILVSKESICNYVKLVLGIELNEDEIDAMGFTQKDGLIRIEAADDMLIEEYEYRDSIVLDNGNMEVNFILLDALGTERGVSRVELQAADNTNGFIIANLKYTLNN